MCSSDLFPSHDRKVQQFGNAFNASTVKGQINVDVDNGYNECINFSGAYQSNLTVYLRAISDSKLEVQGMGKFYNPKYNQSVDGFGIWDNKMYGTLTSIVGQFDYINKEGVTANNGATGLMLAQGMIQWVSGNWSVATSIEGDVSGATASISGFVSPAYSISQKVI